MATLARMQVDLIARTEAFQRDIRNAAQQFEKVGRDMQRIGRTMSTRVTLPLAAIGAASVKMALDAEESANKFNVVMGGAAEDVRRRFQDLHDTIPLTQAQMESLAAGVQDLLVPLGLARDDAAGMSADMVELAADIASFNNVAADVPLEAIKSALAGMSRPLRQFGVDVSQARLETLALSEGLIEQGQALDSAARAQAVMRAVVLDSADAMGDAARTADSGANSLRFLARDARELAQTIGEILVPVVIPLVQRLSEMLRWLRDLDPATQKWIVGIAAAVAAIGPLLIVLGTLLTSLGSLALLLTPAGALVAGLTVVAGIIGTQLVRAQISAAKEARELEEALSGVGRGLRELGEEAAKAALGQFQRGLLEARAVAESLTAEIERAKEEARAPTGRFGLGLEAAGASGEVRKLQSELDEANQRVEEMERLVEEAREAFFGLGEGAGRVAGEVEVAGGATGALNEALETTTRLLADALDLGDRRVSTVTAAIRRQRDLNRQLASGALSLEEWVDAMRELGAIGASLRPILAGAVGSMAALSVHARNVEGALSGPVELANMLGGEVDRAADAARRLGEAGEDAAFSFEDSFVSAIQVVGASLGGLASQVANVVGAFATGGVGAGFAAGLGAVLGGGGSTEASRIRAEEIERATEALGRFADSLQQVSQFVDQSTQAVDLTSDALQALIADMSEFSFVSIELTVEAVRELEREILAMAQSGASAAEIVEALALGHEEMIPVMEDFLRALEQIEEQRQREIQSMRNSLQVQLLRAQGLDDEAAALQEQINRQQQLAEAARLGGFELLLYTQAMFDQIDAARAAREEAERLQAQRTNELSLRVREAQLLGDERAVLEAQLQAQAEAEMRRAQELLDAGKLTEEQFARLVDVIAGEANLALEEFEARLREAAEAQERLNMSFEQELEVMALRLAGREDEARIMEQQIRMEERLRRAREQGIDPELIKRLEELQMEQLRQFIEDLGGELEDAGRDIGRDVGREASRAAQRAAREADGLVQQVRGITEATAMRTNDILLSILSTNQRIEANTRGGQVAATPGPVAARMGGTQVSAPSAVTLNVRVTDDRISVTSDSQGVNVRVMDQAVGSLTARRRRARGRFDRE